MTEQAKAAAHTPGTAYKRLCRWRDVGDGPIEYTAGSKEFGADVTSVLNDHANTLAPFAAADNGDWRALDLLLGHSGHGQFWRGVFKEFQAALAKAEGRS